MCDESMKELYAWVMMCPSKNFFMLSLPDIVSPFDRPWTLIFVFNLVHFSLKYFLRTYVFDDVVMTSVEDDHAGAMVGASVARFMQEGAAAAAAAENAPGGHSNNVTVISMSGDNSTNTFFHSLETLYTSFLGSKEVEKEEEISMTVVEVYDETFRDVLQTNDLDEHVLQHETTNIPNKSSELRGKKKNFIVFSFFFVRRPPS